MWRRGNGPGLAAGGEAAEGERGGAGAAAIL